MKKWLILWAVVMMLAVVASAAPVLRPLPWQVSVRSGATHALEFNYSDLTQTATNTAMVFTNTVTAPASVEFMGMVLDPAFDSATVTNAFSMTLSCGVADSTTKWLNAKQVAADGTEVRTSFGAEYTATVALTLTTNRVASTTYTNGVAHGVATSTVSFVSGATGTSTLTSPLVQEQTANIAILTTFGTAGENRSHSQLESGKVRLFFRVWTPSME
jgi:hypothetical protein